MSFRPSFLPDVKHRPCRGSMMGDAVSLTTDDKRLESLTTGMWATLSVSPPRSPMALSSSPTLGPDTFLLDDVNTSANDECSDCSPDEYSGCGTAHSVMGVAQTWKQDYSDAAIVVFDECPVCTILVNPNIVENKHAVVPHKIVVDSVVWRRMKSSDGRPTGSAFLLSHENNLRITIEVTLRDPLLCNSIVDIERIALVQPRYSALASEAGTCSLSDFIEFDSPHIRLEEMNKVKATLLQDEEQGYLPVREVMVGTALDKLIVNVNEEECKSVEQIHQQVDKHSLSCIHPRRVWAITKDFLRDLSTFSKECTLLHSERELKSLGLVDNKELCDRSFRAYIH